MPQHPIVKITGIHFICITELNEKRQKLGKCHRIFGFESQKNDQIFVNNLSQTKYAYENAK